MKRLGWKLAPVILFLILSIFLGRGLSLDPHRLPSAYIGRAMPEFTLPELQKPQLSFSSKQLRGTVVLLNVWASWCPACIEEQVFLMQLAQEGVLIYGLNYKDTRKNALAWLEQWGNPYQRTLQDTKGLVGIDLGVYGAPETFVVDKQGLIRYRHAGVLNQSVWLDEIQPLIKQLEQAS